MKKNPPIHRVQSFPLKERPQSPRTELDPQDRKVAMLSEGFVEHANAIYEQRGRFPESEIDEWLEAQVGLHNWKKSA